MIPLGDASRHSLHFPIATIALILANVYVYWLEMNWGNAFVAHWALIPAILLVGLWFLIQVFNEFGPFAALQSGGVAYMAHIGGFVFGLLFSRIFESNQRRRGQGLDE